MNKLIEHVVHDAPEYTALLGLFAVAVIANMPTPDKFNHNLWYSWLYDSLQAFMSARNPRPTQPASPAQPKQ
jgi:hypothetical protein